MTTHGIIGKQMLMKLVELGLIEDKGCRVRRVVIDIPYNDLVHVYVEYAGDSRWLNLEFPKGEIKVITGVQTDTRTMGGG